MTELQAIHRDIEDLLAEAACSDYDAREARRLAGVLLLRAKAAARIGEVWLPPDMDSSSAELLIRMATGQREA